jgi:hypothetical protein
MKVLVELWNGKQEIELSNALRPTAWLDDHCGNAEAAKAQADCNAEAIGKLAALLVEKGVIDLDEATHACGVVNVTAI